MRRSAGGNETSLDTRPGQLLVQCVAAAPRRRRAAVQWPRRRMAAELAGTGKRALTAKVGGRIRQPRPGDLRSIRPLKHARLDYLVQKAVEMGASRLQPVITRHTQVARVNLDRMRANSIEAAQQCGVLALPDICEPVAFQDHRRHHRCRSPAGVLRRGCRRKRSGGVAGRGASAGAGLVACGSRARGPAARRVDRTGRRLSEDEREALLKRPNVVRIALGPAFCAPTPPQWRR